jgi:hypothetical protein
MAKDNEFVKAIKIDEEDECTDKKKTAHLLTDDVFSSLGCQLVRCRSTTASAGGATPA